MSDESERTSPDRNPASAAPPRRAEIRPGARVHVIEKHNQRTGIRSTGIVARILTKSPTHPHGIKVMLTDGRVGRVQAVERNSAGAPAEDREPGRPQGRDPGDG
jgi:uncharacterized repeat protein (TIGR03833 family)